MTMPKPVLFGPLPPPYGGVSVFMASIKDACLARGVEVWSYTGNGGDSRVGSVNHRVLGHLRRVLLGLSRARITDSTHFHLEHPHPLLLPLWLRAKRVQKFTWVKICHDATLPSRYEEMPPSVKARLHNALGAIDELVVYSEELQGWFQEKG